MTEELKKKGSKLCTQNKFQLKNLPHFCVITINEIVCHICSIRDKLKYFTLKIHHMISNKKNIDPQVEFLIATDNIFVNSDILEMSHI